MGPTSAVYVAGHRGLVGSALVRRLQSDGRARLLLRTRAELDLTQSDAVADFFMRERPEYVFLAAGRVGGIQANRDRPADFIHDNIALQTSVLRAAWRSGVRRLIFFASACVYPRACPQPMREDALMTGPVEPTSEAYAAAKLAGIAMCSAYNRQHGTQFLAVIPATVYGPNDNFDPDSSHVMSALLRRMHEARLAGDRSVTVWGSGEPVREFIHADDLADACLLLMKAPAPPPLPLNIGGREPVRIRELAGVIRDVVGFRGDLVFDRSKPDGAPEKVLDSARMRGLGWAPGTGLREGIERTYQWYLQPR